MSLRRTDITKLSIIIKNKMKNDFNPSSEIAFTQIPHSEMDSYFKGVVCL